MSNPFFNASGAPITSSQGYSAVIRAEFTAVQAGFALLPAALTANKAVIINSGGSGMTLTTGSLALAGDLTTTGAFNTTFVQGASVSLTLPLTSGTLANLASVLGTANEITATVAATSVTLSLPAALTFTGKTVTGGTFSSPSLTGTPTASSLAINGATLGANKLAVAGDVNTTGQFRPAFAQSNTAMAAGIMMGADTIGIRADTSNSLCFDTYNGGAPGIRAYMNQLGNWTIVGALAKGSGSFKIDHPLPSKKDSHHLVHSFIEGPQADLIYRGSVVLAGGSATVNIDAAAGMSEGTFVLLCRDVQCFTSNEEDWTLVKGRVAGNILTITAQDPTSRAKIGWLVVGERCDPHMYETEWTDENGKVIVEPLKEQPK